MANGITRRQALGSAAGLTSIVVGTEVMGFTNIIPFLGGGLSVRAVPENADTVAYMNVDVVRGDDATRTLGNAYLDQQSEYDWYDGPTDVEEVLENIEDEYDIDLSRVHEAIWFGRYGGENEYTIFDSDYRGAIVKANITPEDIKDALEEAYDYAFDEDEHSEMTVYEPESEYGYWVGVLSQNKAVIGTEDAVKETLDVKDGNEDPVDSDLRNAYSKSRNAPIRFAGRIPDPTDTMAVPEKEETRGGETLDYTILGDVTTLYGSVYREGNVRGATTTMTTEDKDTAEELTELAEKVQETVDERVYEEAVADIVGDISISQTGTDVTASVEKEISDLEELIEEEAGP